MQLNCANYFEIMAVLCGGLALRSIVSLYSYSGAGTPPLFGDYEAQRHWQEITINLNIREWYKNGTSNNLLYWGLDYPPLTAYHSYVLGRVAKVINPKFVELWTSQGHESPEHKSFMRFSVLLADLLVYIPGVTYLCLSMRRLLGEKNPCLAMIVLYMLYPGQILIDNGHFQYNNISLGLAAFAIAELLNERYYISAACFCLALSYKQMELYHSLPFFFYLLTTCDSYGSFKIMKLVKLAVVVAATFLIIWFPWLSSAEDLISIVRRMFPFGRGVFEDKVSNVWCAIDIIYKLRHHLTNEKMASLCLAVTALLALPINICLFLKRNKTNFVFALFNTAITFFLFSFQVHEKSILLVTLPACLLLYWIPMEIVWLLEISTLSMLPLLAKDNLYLPFFTLMIIFHMSFKCIYFKYMFKNAVDKTRRVGHVLLALMVILSIVALAVPPPQKYPYLWPLIISVFCCGQFVFIFVLGSFKQFFLIN